MGATLDKYGFKDIDKDIFSPGFPKPEKKFMLTWERFFASIEEPYFFVLSTLRDSLGWKEVDKIKDIFSASESSAFYGSIGSRLSIAQDRAAHYSASIGKFLQELFKMVREMRIIDERIKLQEDSDKGDRAADKALKGIWTDMVEGGSKNPSSVIGLGMQVGFTILPDLFFGTYVKSSDKVHEEVEKLQFNKKVKEVLARKLKAYMVWKEKTSAELINRQSFMKKHIKQYFLTIKMYMNWLRPYLTHIKRLEMDETKLSSPDIVSGFETSMVELETLFKKKNKKDNFYSVILVHFLFSTQPKMEFHQESYQHRGPVHVGRVQMTFRGYVWSKEEYENYKKYRSEEDFELLSTINEEMKAALDTLGDDIKRYLLDLGEKFEEDVQQLMRDYNLNQAELTRWERSYDDAKQKEDYKGSFRDYLKENKDAETEKLKLKTLFDPFKDLVNGFSEMITGREAFGKDKDKKKKLPTRSEEWQAARDKAAARKDDMLPMLWKSYEIFKKAHGMLAW